MRHVFFSFEYEHDVFRANVVRKSWVTKGTAADFRDGAEFESVKRQGDAAIQQWIERQLHGTSVTVVLVGSHTCTSRWVRYEIERSQELRMGLLGIDISGISDPRWGTSHFCGRIPGVPVFYNWTRDNGHENLGSWIEAAAQAAGR